MNTKLERWIDELTLALKRGDWSLVIYTRAVMMEEVQPQWAVCRTFMPCGESELKFVRARSELEARDLAFPSLAGQTEEELNAKGTAYCVRRVEP